MTDWRTPLPADEVIGYYMPPEIDENGDDTGISLFWCEYHKDEDWSDMVPITVADTWNHYYQCDRMGCELSWHNYPIKENNQ